MRIGHNQSTQEYHSSEQPIVFPIFPPIATVVLSLPVFPMVFGSPVLHHPGEQEIVAVAIKQLPADIREAIGEALRGAQLPATQLPLEMFIHLI